MTDLELTLIAWCWLDTALGLLLAVAWARFFLDDEL